jgi:hypothetical protein
VLAFPSSAETASVGGDSGIRTEFVDVTGDLHVVRSDAPTLDKIDQAIELIQWDLPEQPDLSTAFALLQDARG